ncbi:MAG TPA: ferrous iron transport protein A [Thermoprotei archaeon]|nr:ferrous iron transport protein A [Thermoprotei archaeon]
MYRFLRLSEAPEGFRGRVVTIVDVGEAQYKYYNMGFYPGNTVIIVYRGEDTSIIRLGRRVLRVPNNVLEKVLSVEDDEVPIIDWS